MPTDALPEVRRARELVRQTYDLWSEIQYHVADARRVLSDIRSRVGQIKPGDSPFAPLSSERRE